MASAGTQFNFHLSIDGRQRYTVTRYPRSAWKDLLTAYAADETSSEFRSITITSEELSVIAPQHGNPFSLKYCHDDESRQEEDFVMIKVQPKEGPEIDFGVTGLLAKLSTILAQKHIPIFALSTYNTDYILIRNEYLDMAVTAFQGKGVEVFRQG